MASDIPELSRLLVATRDHYRCSWCGGPAPRGDWHHRRSRAVADEWTHDPCNGVLLHRRCHSAVHAHVLLARQRGFILSRYVTEPWAVPIKLWSGWAVLNKDAGVDAPPETFDLVEGEAEIFYYRQRSI